MKMRYSTFAVVLVLSLTVSGCRDKQKEIGGSGLIETTETIVSSETTGRVKSLRFDEGIDISIGDTLIVIDNSRLEIELASAKAGRRVAVSGLERSRLQVESARRARDYALVERDRLSRMEESGNASSSQMDKAQFDYDSAELVFRQARAGMVTAENEVEGIDAGIALLQRSIEDCYPVSPVSGTVTQRYIETGELLSPGRPIAQIAVLDTVWVKVYLPTGEFANVRIGDRADVDTESGRVHSEECSNGGIAGRPGVRRKDKDP